MRGWAPLLCFAGLLPASLAAQARIETILPADARIALSRLGADRPEVASEGASLEPGDLLEARGEGISIGLTCTSPEGTNSYLITAPFRVLVDVPTAASCHVNLLSGLTEVVAEAPTETTAGGVTLGSTGTQYAVELRRDEAGLVFNCFVYDESVRVLSRPGLEASAGQKLVWTADRTVAVAANTQQDLSRSAATYARFDVAAATRQGTPVADTAAAIRALTTLHMDVLAHPSDTTRRVALAKEQLRYNVRSRAMYNLDRVDVRDPARLRTYDIDPSAVTGRRRSPSTGTAAAARARPDARMAAGATAAAATTTDGDLRLIEAGSVDEAIAHLEARVASGYATSRDEFALAKAYAQRGASDQARAHAGRALVRHAGDGALSAAELRELGELIGRLD